MLLLTFSALTIEYDKGHYRALEWDDKTQTYAPHEELGIQVDIEARGPLLMFCFYLYYHPGNAFWPLCYKVPWASRRTFHFHIPRRWRPFHLPQHELHYRLVFQFAHSALPRHGCRHHTPGH